MEQDKLRDFNRIELCDLMQRACYWLSVTPSPHWQEAYAALFSALNYLDAVIARCTVSGNQLPLTQEGE